MTTIDITKPVKPQPLTGIRIDPRTNEPVVQMQIMGTIPFKFLLEKADPESLKQIIRMAREQLNTRGITW